MATNPLANSTVSVTSVERGSLRILSVPSESSEAFQEYLAAGSIPITVELINRKISLTVAGGSSYQFSVPFTLFISVAKAEKEFLKSPSDLSSLKKLLVTEFIILIAPEVLPIAIL